MVASPATQSTPATPAALLDALLDSIARVPDQIALICGDRRLTYRQLGHAVAAVARELDACGARKGRVIILLVNSIEAVVATLAVLAARAEAVPLNPFLTPNELAPAFAAAKANALITDSPGHEKSLRVSGGAQPPMTLFLEPGQSVEWPTDVLGLTLLKSDLPAADEPGLLLFTGGTTGTPKGVRHPHRSLGASLRQHCQAWPLRFGAERFLSSAPMFHSWGLVYSTWVPLYTGGTLVIVPKFDAAIILQAIAAHHVTVLAGGPATIYLGLLADPLADTTDFSSLRYCLTGGAPCPPAVHQKWRERTGCELLEGWGMSEAAPLCLSRAGSARIGSVGQPVADTRVEIVDSEAGTPLPLFQPGEVRVSGPQLMTGYLETDGMPSDALRDGWLYTGDIGYLDGEGYLFLVARKKHVIIVGGYNVYPRQVEDVLLRMPEVANAACVGLADERLGEVVVAFIVLRETAHLTEAACLDYCKTNLVKYRRPAHVAFIDELPLTSARKVDTRRLKAMARELFL
jgi:long-chain acyl-CoA synthetase